MLDMFSEAATGAALVDQTIADDLESGTGDKARKIFKTKYDEEVAASNNAIMRAKGAEKMHLENAKWYEMCLQLSL